MIALGLVATARYDAPSEALISVRDLLFTTYSADTAELGLTPDSLVRRGFIVDTPNEISDLARRLRATPSGARLDSIARISSPIARAQSVLRTAFAGGSRTGCGSVTDLRQKVDWVRDGGGCCSDYVEVFIALSSVVGLDAREINFGDDHTVAAVFDTQSNRWIFVDPLYGLMALDPAGGWMTTREVQDRMTRRQPPRFVFVGNPTQPYAATSREKAITAEQPARHDDYMMTFGNDVVAADNAYRHVAWLPKPAAEFIGFVSGVRPGYRIYDAGLSRGAVALLNARRWAFVVFAALLVASWLSLAWTAARFAGRRLAGRGQAAAAN